MYKLLSTVLCAVLLANSSLGAPASSSPSSTTSTVDGNVTSGTTSSTAATPSFTVPLASDDPNDIEWNVTTTDNVQPIRGSLGATILGPQNLPIDQQNPDILAPPTTDAGSVPNIKWPFSLSHNRIQTGG